MSRPLVLLSNDDGYRSLGINSLAAALRQVADVVICAPEVEQSAASHALSLHRPLRLFRHGEFVPYTPESDELPEVPWSADWYRGWRDHLGFARVVQGLPVRGLSHES